MERARYNKDRDSMTLDSPTLPMIYTIHSTKDDTDPSVPYHVTPRKGLKNKAKDPKRFSAPGRVHRYQEAVRIPVSPTVKFSPPPAVDNYNTNQSSTEDGTDSSQRTPSERRQNYMASPTAADDNLYTEDGASLNQTPTTKRALFQPEDVSNIPSKQADGTKGWDSPLRRRVTFPTKQPPASPREGFVTLLPSPTLIRAGSFPASDGKENAKDAEKSQSTDTLHRRRSAPSKKSTMSGGISPQRRSVTFLPSPTYRQRRVPSPDNINARPQTLELLQMLGKNESIPLAQPEVASPIETMPKVSVLEMTSSPTIQYSPPRDSKASLAITRENVFELPTSPIVSSPSSHKDKDIIVALSPTIQYLPSNGNTASPAARKENVFELPASPIVTPPGSHSDKYFTVKPQQLLETDLDDPCLLHDPPDSGYYDDKSSLDSFSSLHNRYAAEPAKTSTDIKPVYSQPNATVPAGRTTPQGTRAESPDNVNKERNFSSGWRKLDGINTKTRTNQDKHSPPASKQGGADDADPDKALGEKAEDLDSEGEDEDYEVVEVRAQDIVTPEKVYTEEVVVRRRRRRSGKMQWSFQVKRKSWNAGQSPGSPESSTVVNQIDQAHSPVISTTMEAHSDRKPGGSSSATSVKPKERANTLPVRRASSPPSMGIGAETFVKSAPPVTKPSSAAQASSSLQSLDQSASNKRASLPGYASPSTQSSPKYPRMSNTEDHSPTENNSSRMKEIPQASLRLPSFVGLDDQPTPAYSTPGERSPASKGTTSPTTPKTLQSAVTSSPAADAKVFLERKPTSPTPTPRARTTVNGKTPLGKVTPATKPRSSPANGTSEIPKETATGKTYSSMIFTEQSPASDFPIKRTPASSKDFPYSASPSSSQGRTSRSRMSPSAKRDEISVSTRPQCGSGYNSRSFEEEEKPSSTRSKTPSSDVPEDGAQSEPNATEMKSYWQMLFRPFGATSKFLQVHIKRLWQRRQLSWWIVLAVLLVPLAYGVRQLQLQDVQDSPP